MGLRVKICLSKKEEGLDFKIRSGREPFLAVKWETLSREPEEIVFFAGREGGQKPEENMSLPPNKVCPSMKLMWIAFSFVVCVFFFHGNFLFKKKNICALVSCKCFQ